MTELSIELAQEQTAFKPAEAVRGKVSWTVDPPPQFMELRLFWFTRGKGTEDAGIVQTVRFDQPLPHETRSFEVCLPEAPYSFSGKLISLVWALELVAYPSKQVARREIEMGPDGKEVRIESVQTSGLARRWLEVRAT
ncbi:MAG TPA: hypothetical protein VFE51_24515 [Verrucomicrobiae bacterium]|nr:hypothetical protein [Verrucomicrobiae bacterium]